MGGAIIRLRGRSGASLVPPFSAANSDSPSRHKEPTALCNSPRSDFSLLHYCCVTKLCFGRGQPVKPAYIMQQPWVASAAAFFSPAHVLLLIAFFTPIVADGERIPVDSPAGRCRKAAAQCVAKQISRQRPQSFYAAVEAYWKLVKAWSASIVGQLSRRQRNERSNREDKERFV